MKIKLLKRPQINVNVLFKGAVMKSLYRFIKLTVNDGGSVLGSRVRGFFLGVRVMKHYDGFSDKVSTEKKGLARLYRLV